MRLLICICFLALFSSCFQTERNCSDYKTGTFEFSYLDNGVEKTAKFTRTEDYSIDFIEGKADSSSVRWINDCEFILKKLHPKSTQEAKAIHMKIEVRVFLPSSGNKKKRRKMVTQRRMQRTFF